MASKFTHLKQADVAGNATARYTMHAISVNGHVPTLIVKPATEANAGYFNALLARTGRHGRQVANGAMSAQLIQENRAEDKELYPIHIIVGWEDVVDEHLTPVQFTKDDCRDFIRELPAHIFDDLREFCGKPRNFTTGINIDADEVAGN